MERYLKPEQEELLLILTAVDLYETEETYTDVWDKYYRLKMEPSYLEDEELNNLKILDKLGLIKLTLKTIESTGDEGIDTIEVLPDGHRYMNALSVEAQNEIEPTETKESCSMPSDSKEPLDKFVKFLEVSANFVTIGESFANLIYKICPK